VVRGWLRWAVHGEQETAADGGRQQRCSGRNWRATGSGELEQRLEKLARGLVGAMGGRQWLPTTSRSRRSGRRGDSSGARV
jgi:hypothetical protein